VSLEDTRKRFFQFDAATLIGLVSSGSSIMC
jgi:hypothetical protein